MYNSLRYAVREGPLNMIDTSYAFRLGRSERVIGRFMENTIAAGAINRSQIIVASKCGFAAVRNAYFRMMQFKKLVFKSNS